jgi:nucleoside-diphosphate-sugar epimerase
MKNNVIIISYKLSLKKAIKTIEQSDFRIALIVNNVNEYYSQITITEIRRFILSGMDQNTRLKDIVSKDNLFIYSRDLKNKKYLVSLMKNFVIQNIDYVSIINSKNIIIDVLHINEMKDEKTVLSTKTNYKDNVRNVLVIGGAGYLGNIVVRKILDSGRNVRVLDSFIYGAQALSDLEHNPKLQIVEGDFRNIETVVSCLEDIDAVILLAAVVGDPASKARPTQTIETNLLAAQSLAYACSTHCISRFIYASTCSVYGKGDKILDENSTLNPISLYARTKIASEKSILNMSNSNFKPTILRMGTLYGYSKRMRFDLVVNTMTMKAFTDKKIQVFGGEQWRPLLHVDDAADVYCKCIDKPLDIVGSQIFNVGSEEQNYQIKDISKIICSSIKNIKIETLKSDIDNRDYQVSFQKIKIGLQFMPKNSIQNSCKKIYKSLQNEEFKNPEAKVYYNHYFDSTEEI